MDFLKVFFGGKQRWDISRRTESKGFQLYSVIFPNHQQKHYVKIVTIREIKILSRDFSLHSLALAHRNLALDSPSVLRPLSLYGKISNET